MPPRASLTRRRGRSARKGLAAVLAVLASGCASGQPPGSAAPSGDGPLVVVSAPLTASPWIGRFTQRGAELAVAQLNAQPGRLRKLRLQVLDNAGSPQQAAANARRAVAEHAAVLVTDGTGAAAVASVSDPVSLPVFVVFDGGGSFISAHTHPTVFRLAPADTYLARRLADYTAGKAKPVAVFSDDSGYGREGAAALTANLRHDNVPIAASPVLPVGVSDASAQVLTARRAGAQAVFIWSGAADIAAVVRAARSTGWNVPFYTSPTGEDPLVRQQLADHPPWLDGLTFVSFRITTEQGPGPFNTFRTGYERRYGPDTTGVSAGGRPVVQPPDWATFSYDAVGLIAAAADRSGATSGAALLSALQMVSVTGANGDDRGYGPDDREGVSPSDMYMAQFHDLRFSPVHDDLLSTSLPTIAQ